MAAIAAVNAAFYIQLYVQLLRAEELMGQLAQVSRQTGAHTYYFISIGIFLSYAVICFLLLLLPNVSRPYRKRARRSSGG